MNDDFEEVDWGGKIFRLLLAIFNEQDKVPSINDSFQLIWNLKTRRFLVNLKNLIDPDNQKMNEKFY